MNLKGNGPWLKNYWFFIALVVLLFLAAVAEHGLVHGAWVAGATCYVIALMRFCALAIPAVVFRRGLSWQEWSLLAYAGSFVALAYALGFEQLIPAGLIGLVTGVFLGLVFLFFAWHLREK